ncbi:MAG: YtxH domain-containing protein, partial [Gemmatimonadota bacterium]|nr:YtxH domain-containing protein [Gemmatimonadota bacterium]
MRDSEDLPYVVIERERGGLEPFLWGALLGAGVALLMAPRSGTETQREIRDRVTRIRDTAQGRVNDARGVIDRTRGQVRDRIGGLRGVVESRVEQARDAVDTGRRAARDARSELERRLSDAKAAYGGGGDDAGGA